MTMFIIERTIPGASELSLAELQKMSATSNEAVASLGVPYVWHHSYVAGDKFYCVHETDDVDAVIEHSLRGAFPCDTVTPIVHVIDPQTADRRLTATA